MNENEQTPEERYEALSEAFERLRGDTSPEGTQALAQVSIAMSLIEQTSEAEESDWSEEGEEEEEEA